MIQAAANDRLLNRKQAAELAGISVCTLDRMTSAGKTPKPVKLSAGTVRFRASDLARWIELGCPARAEFEALSAPAKGGRR